MRRASYTVVLLAALLVQPGCQTWKPVTGSPEALFQADPPQRVRITRNDGFRIVLEAPQIRAGAMVATASPGAILLEDIEQVEVRGVSVLRTVGFLIPGAVIVFLVGKRACRC